MNHNPVVPLFFDIETIATTKPGYRERVSSTIKPPAQMKKSETIAKWEAEEKEGAISEAVEKSVFNGGLCHVVQIQWAFGDDEIMVVQDDDERSVISFFFCAIESRPYIGEFVGHYITGFDLRVLKQRAIVLGLKIPAQLEKAANAKPWDACVFDTMVEWSGLKGSVSMDDLCYYLDIETPKKDMDGAHFGEYWNSGKRDLCMQYGIAEIEALRKVYKRMKGE